MTKSLLFSLLSLEDYMLPCFAKKYIGIDCMGCGIQRSLAFILRGEFVAAFKMYPAIYTLILLFVVAGINIFYKFSFTSKLIQYLAVINVTIIIISFINKYLN
ncbi:DUF2752 domain-containing protein [Kordia algicida OT-1]|nr:DUF2752 domain-containing protein [Kordia algicida]